MKTLTDFQISQPLTTTTTGPVALTTSPIAFAEVGVNVTSATNDVVIQGLLGLYTTAALVQLAVKVLRDDNVVFAEQVTIEVINSVVNAPIIFTDINAPVGFHAYTLTAEIIPLTVTTGGYVIGPISLSAMLLVE